MSDVAVTETQYLVGPELSTEVPCPACKETVTVHGIMFPDDETEVTETCHWCGATYVIRRRTHFVGYTLTAASEAGGVTK